MKVGLALSGGAARGIAHIGVIKYLEENGIKAACVAGTSAGSIVGSLYCSGKTVEELEKIAATMSWKDLVRFSLPHKGLFDSKSLLKVLRKHLGNKSFEELKIPLIINAVDLISGKEQVITKGDLAEAVSASCAIPGIFTPVKTGSYLLVDGGLLNNLPAALLKDKNLDYIISVNVGAQRALKKEPETIIEILVQSFDVIRRQRDMPGLDYTDTLVEPELGDIAVHDTSKVDLLIERGYKAAREALKDVNLSKKPGRLSRWLGRRNK